MSDDGRLVWRRMWRWRQRRSRSCCWYHAGDWGVASELAVELVAAAVDGGVAAVDNADHVMDEVRRRRTDSWTTKAVESLVTPEMGISVEAGHYGNGQHRARANPPFPTASSSPQDARSNS